MTMTMLKLNFRSRKFMFIKKQDLVDLQEKADSLQEDIKRLEQKMYEIEHPFLFKIGDKVLWNENLQPFLIIERSFATDFCYGLKTKKRYKLLSTSTHSTTVADENNLKLVIKKAGK